ncbi:MAG: radical SAM/SPASM domain-containing protein [Candidatus Omnitrophota bacterium]
MTLHALSVKPVPNYLSKVARNHARILNHRHLIGKKIAVGRLIGAVESKCYPEEVTKKISLILGDLQAGRIRTPAALDGIYSLNRHSKVRLSSSLFRRYLGMLIGAGHIEIHPTDVCDHDCVGCYYRDRGNAVMPFENIKKILKTYRPRSVVLVGGGEPTLYKYKGRGLSDIVLEIKRNDPSIQIGLVTKGTHIPKGDWQRHIDWVRVSMDAATAETFFRSKKKDVFGNVLDNYFKYLSGPIPHVGIGYLLWSGNIHEAHEICRLIHGRMGRLPSSSAGKANIQFRPMRPGVDVPEKVRKNHVSADMICSPEQVNGAMEEFERSIAENTGLSDFILYHTNWDKVAEGNGLRAGKPFDKCYYCLAFRIFRPSGEVYPCFVRVSDPEYLIGDLNDGSDEGLIRTGLLPFLYFNEAGLFCTEDKCRMSWLNNIAENGIRSASECSGETADSFFF